MMLGPNSKRVSSLLLIALRSSSSFTTTTTTTSSTTTSTMHNMMRPMLSSTTTRLMTTTSTSSETNNNSNNRNTKDRLFPEEVNVIYDSKCNVCKLEIDWLARRDERMNAPNRKLKMTDLESGNYNPNDPANGMIGYRQGMEAIHAVQPDGKVLKGVPVFAIAYEQVGLGWLFAITTWPVLKSVTQFGYKIFAKYRTYITRGSSVDELVRVYEERQGLFSKADGEDCEVCKTNGAAVSK